MDYMEYSTIHLKVPHTVHIGAKVLAAQNQTSMNHYIIDLIEAAMAADGMKHEEVQAGIDGYREMTKLMPKAEIKEKLDQAIKDIKSAGSSVKFCQHGAAIGLCKFGCTK